MVVIDSDDDNDSRTLNVGPTPGYQAAPTPQPHPPASIPAQPEFPAPIAVQTAQHVLESLNQPPALSPLAQKSAGPPKPPPMKGKKKNKLLKKKPSTKKTTDTN
eukprot:6987005-Alexandrium_andersonii.AAC.1